MSYSRIAAIVLAVMLMVTILPGTARAEEVKLTYILNFGGTSTLHSSTWNRVEVTVANSSSDDLQGSVVVGSGGDYVQDIFIEAGKSANLVFYLPPTELAEGWSARGSHIQISVLNQRGREVASSLIRTAGLPSEAVFIGVLGRTPGNFGRLSNVLEKTKVVGANPGHLDNVLFAQNLGVIIISDPGIISLSPAQQTNLKTWVEAGGTLIIGGGSGWRQTTALVPVDILPVLPGTIATVTGADLAVLQLPVQPGASDYTVALGDVQGKVLLSTGDIPLLVSKSLGQGSVVWSALDLEAAPLENPANNEAFWEQVFLRLPYQGLSTSNQRWGIGQVFNSLSLDSLASTLSPLKIFLLLIGYILLIGPVNWLILRKIDRREWAWLTIPALALVFTVGAFTAGSLGRGTERILYQVNLVEVHSNDTAELQSYSGVFVPKRGAMILESLIDLVPMQGAVSRVVAGQSRLELTNPPLWSVQRFYAAGFVEIPGAFTVTASVDTSNVGRMHFEITNNSGHGMFDSYIRMGNRWYAVGELAPDETKTMTVTAQPNIDFHSILQRYSNTGSSGHWFEFEQILPDAPFAFVGFGDDGVLPITGAGKTVAMDLWVQVLPMVKFNSGTIDIPEGILTPTLIGGYDGTKWQYGGEYNFEGQGSFDLVFSMPSGLDYSQGEYRLNFRSFWGQAKGSIEIYNFASSQWQEIMDLDSLMKSQNHFIVLDNPDDSVRDNRLTARVTYDGHLGFSLRTLDITVKGGHVND